MRISLGHEEVAEGRVFRRVFHDVCVTVHFTHEEQQIIKQRGLGEYVLLERNSAGMQMEDVPDWYTLKVRHLLERRPDRHRCANPAEAKAYEAQLTQALTNMKAWLEANAELGEARVFEL